jgi:hypothetical protein
MLDLLTPAVLRRYPDGLTLEECGVLVGVSRERIRQIERSGMAKLRLLQRIKVLAAPDEAWALIDGLKGCDVEQFREGVRRLKQERPGEASRG